MDTKELSAECEYYTVLGLEMKKGRDGNSKSVLSKVKSQSFRTPGEFVNYWYLLHECSILAATKTFQLLSKLEGVDLNLKNHAHDSPLTLAAMYNSISIANLLCTNPKCFVNIIDFNGKTALHWASLKGHQEICKILLLHKNIDWSVKDITRNVIPEEGAEMTAIKKYILENKVKK